MNSIPREPFIRSQNRTRTSPLEGRRMVVDETGRRREGGGAGGGGEREERENSSGVEVITFDITTRWRDSPGT